MQLRKVDVVARYGGEEFVVVMPDTPLEGAMEVAERLRIGIEGLGIPHKRSSAAICRGSWRGTRNSPSMCARRRRAGCRTWGTCRTSDR